MGRRTLLRKHQVFSDADTSTNPLSLTTDISGLDLVTYQVEIDPTVDALVTVQYCNDERGDGEYKTLFFNQPTPLDGSVDSGGLIHIENKGFKWLRLSVANNGGTGAVSAWITGSVGGA